MTPEDKIIGLFSLLGPLIGTYSLMLPYALLDLYAGKLSFGDFAGAVLLFALIGYAIGLVPAIIAGLAVVFVRQKQFRYEFVFISIVGLLIGLILSAVWKGAYISLTAICLISTIICWAVTLKLRVVPR